MPKVNSNGDDTGNAREPAVAGDGGLAMERKESARRTTYTQTV